MFRKQHDSVDEMTIANGLVCNPDEDMTRQEFRDEADVNKLMMRHGLVPRPVQYGEWDFDQDLTSSVQTRQAVSEAYAVLPQEVRAKFPDMGSVWAAIASGALKIGPEGVEVASTPSEPQQAPEEGAR